MNKRFNKATVGLFVAALSVAALAVQDAVTLKRDAKVGETIKLKLRADLVVMDQDATFEGLVTEKVTKVEPNGNYTVESTQSEGKISVGGQEMPADLQSQTFVYKANGELVEIKADQVGSEIYRMANLQAVILPSKPVKVGDDWTYEFKKDDKTGAVAGKATYKVVAMEKIGDYDCLKILVSAKESDGGDMAASIDGNIWLSAKDATTVKFQGDWKNVPIPNAGPVNAKFVMTRQ